MRDVLIIERNGVRIAVPVRPVAERQQKERQLLPPTKLEIKHTAKRRIKREFC